MTFVFQISFLFFLSYFYFKNKIRVLPILYSVCGQHDVLGACHEHGPDFHPNSQPSTKALSPQLLGGLASMALLSPSQEIASQPESCLPQGHSLFLSWGDHIK